MSCFKMPNHGGWAALLVVAASLGLLLAAPAQAVTPADADLAFSSLNKVYWDPASKFFRKEEHRAAESRFLACGATRNTVMISMTARERGC